MILTVTLNAAIDRTLTVPNFSVGFRHRATETLTLPGGKGVNVARVVKTLGQPVIATGFAGGRTGERIVAELNREGILCDFVRIEAESRTSTAVVDPRGNTATEINEYGPEIRHEEVELMIEKLEYLCQAADVVVLAGSLPRSVEPGIYAQLITRLKGHGITVLFDTFGEPLRQGIKAGPDVVFPNQVEAEMVIGYEFSGNEDFVSGAAAPARDGRVSAVIKSTAGLRRAVRHCRRRAHASGRGRRGSRRSRRSVRATRSWAAMPSGCSRARRPASACASASPARPPTPCRPAPACSRPRRPSRLTAAVELIEAVRRDAVRLPYGDERGARMMTPRDEATSKVLVLDFGGQYAQLIARRVRECRVYSELIPHDTPLARIRAAAPAGIILSGGPRSVNEPGAPALDPRRPRTGRPRPGHLLRAAAA